MNLDQLILKERAKQFNFGSFFFIKNPEKKAKNESSANISLVKSFEKPKINTKNDGKRYDRSSP